MSFRITEQDAAALRDMAQWWRARLGNTRNRPAVPEQDLTAPEVYVVKVPSSGIPGLIDETSTVGTGTYGEAVPGSAQCYTYRYVENELFQHEEYTRTVYNLSADPIEANSWALAVKDKHGTLYAIQVVTSEHILSTESDSTSGCVAIAGIDDAACLKLRITSSNGRCSGILVPQEITLISEGTGTGADTWHGLSNLQTDTGDWTVAYEWPEGACCPTLCLTYIANSSDGCPDELAEHPDLTITITDGANAGAHTLEWDESTQSYTAIIGTQEVGLTHDSDGWHIRVADEGFFDGTFVSCGPLTVNFGAFLDGSSSQLTNPIGSGSVETSPGTICLRYLGCVGGALTFVGFGSDLCGGVVSSPCAGNSFVVEITCDPTCGEEGAICATCVSDTDSDSGPYQWPPVLYGTIITSTVDRPDACVAAYSVGQVFRFTPTYFAGHDVAYEAIIHIGEVVHRFIIGSSCAVSPTKLMGVISDITNNAFLCVTLEGTSPIPSGSILTSCNPVSVVLDMEALPEGFHPFNLCAVGSAFSILITE